jgi:hypothetical protein
MDTTITIDKVEMGSSLNLKLNRDELVRVFKYLGYADVKSKRLRGIKAHAGYMRYGVSACRQMPGSTNFFFTRTANGNLAHRRHLFGAGWHRGPSEALDGNLNYFPPEHWIDTFAVQRNLLVDESTKDTAAIFQAIQDATERPIPPIPFHLKYLEIAIDHHGSRDELAVLFVQHRAAFVKTIRSITVRVDEEGSHLQGIKCSIFKNVVAVMYYKCADILRLEFRFSKGWLNKWRSVSLSDAINEAALEALRLRDKYWDADAPLVQELAPHEVLSSLLGATAPKQKRNIETLLTKIVHGNGQFVALTREGKSLVVLAKRLLAAGVTEKVGPSTYQLKDEFRMLTRASLLNQCNLEERK